MEINIQATMGTCDQFLDNQGGQPTQISVVIAPLKITTDEASGKTQIISGCSVWRSCFNKVCWYSVAARQSKKV